LLLVLSLLVEADFWVSVSLSENVIVNLCLSNSGFPSPPMVGVLNPFLRLFQFFKSLKWQTQNSKR